MQQLCAKGAAFTEVDAAFAEAAVVLGKPDRELERIAVRVRVTRTRDFQQVGQLAEKKLGIRAFRRPGMLPAVDECRDVGGGGCQSGMLHQFGNGMRLVAVDQRSEHVHEGSKRVLFVLPHLVGMGKNGPDILNVGKVPPTHPAEPLRQAGLAVRVIRREVIQSLSCDDVHRRARMSSGHGNGRPN